MFSIFSTSCITTVKTLFLIYLDTSIILLQEIPHFGSRFTILILLKCQKYLHLNLHLFGNSFHFLFQMLDISFSCGYTHLICKYNQFIPLFLKFLHFFWDTLMPKNPIISVFSKFSPRFNSK